MMQPHAAVIFCNCKELETFPLTNPELYFLRMYFLGLQDIEILRHVSSLLQPGFAIISIKTVRKNVGHSTAQSTSYRDWLYAYLLQEGMNQAERVQCTARMIVESEDPTASRTDDMEWLFEKGLNISPSPELTNILSSATLSKCVIERSLSCRFSHFDERHRAYDMQLRHYNNLIRHYNNLRSRVTAAKSWFSQFKSIYTPRE